MWDWVESVDLIVKTCKWVICHDDCKKILKKSNSIAKAIETPDLRFEPIWLIVYLTL